MSQSTQCLGSVLPLAMFFRMLPFVNLTYNNHFKSIVKKCTVRDSCYYHVYCLALCLFDLSEIQRSGSAEVNTKTDSQTPGSMR